MNTWIRPSPTVRPGWRLSGGSENIVINEDLRIIPGEYDLEPARRMTLLITWAFPPSTPTQRTLSQ